MPLLLPLLLLLATFLSFPSLAGPMPDPASPSPRPTVIFVHGMYMTPASWSHWRDWFQARGYDTRAPAWPGRHGEPAALRASPDPALRSLDLPQVVDVYRREVASLDQPPILIGHSMGGLVVQLLLQEGLGAAGVAIDSAPPKGLSSTRWSFLRSNLPVLSPGKAPINPTLAQFRYAFAHTLPEDEVARIYAQYVVPESRQVGRGPTTAAARVDFTRARPPLLLIAGEEDHIIPASLVAAQADRYARGPSVTTLRSFPGRVHWIVGQEGWEEVAEAVAGWLAEQGLPGAD